MISTLLSFIGLNILSTIVGDFMDLFVPKELIANKTGKWYLGLFSLAENYAVNETIFNNGTCEEHALTK